MGLRSCDRYIGATVRFDTGEFSNLCCFYGFLSSVPSSWKPEPWLMPSSMSFKRLPRAGYPGKTWCVDGLNDVHTQGKRRCDRAEGEDPDGTLEQWFILSLARQRRTVQGQCFVGHSCEMDSKAIESLHTSTANSDGACVSKQSHLAGRAVLPRGSLCCPSHREG